MRVAGALMVVGLIVLGVAAPSTARRPPTHHQRAALARFLGTPAKCMVLRISTPHVRWASARFRPGSGRSCRKYASNGIDFLHRRHGRWHHVSGESDCPKRLPPVPDQVYRDLTRGYCKSATAGT